MSRQTRIGLEVVLLIRPVLALSVRPWSGLFHPTRTLENDLAACYKNTLDMCLENGLKSVAFCCISTGVFHFPNERAAEIAVKTVTDWLAAHPGTMERVIFNVFKDEDKGYYEQLLQ